MALQLAESTLQMMVQDLLKFVLCCKCTNGNEVLLACKHLSSKERLQDKPTICLHRIE